MLNGCAASVCCISFQASQTIARTHHTTLHVGDRAGFQGPLDAKLRILFEVLQLWCAQCKYADRVTDAVSVMHFSSRAVGCCGRAFPALAGQFLQSVHVTFTAHNLIQLSKPAHE